MKRSAYLLIALVMVLMAAQSYASIQLNTLPSTKFVRSTGEPKTETKTFSGIGGPARIKLVNGDLSDTTIERVSSSMINVNGVLVFGSSDFNQKVSTLERDINLNDGPNTLSVLLKGKPGGTVSIQIIQVLENIKLQPSNIRLQEKGATSQITLTGELSNGKVVNITDPSFGTTISSLNSGVATVSPSGLVTAVANGDTNIWITNGSFGANIPVTVQITQSSRAVGQEGGTLEFHNGLVLEVPPGAVAGPTPILIKDLPWEQATAIVTNPALSSNRTKRILGGFSAEPDGLVFTGPVLATIPVLPLDPWEIPVQIEILLNEQRYRYVTSQFEYLRDQGVVKVYVQHFSSLGFIGVKEEGPTPEERKTCTTCPLPVPIPEYCIDPLHLEPPCCNIPIENRYTTCGYGPLDCDCCREKDPVHVTEIGVDVSTEKCQLLGSTVSATYYGCPGSPTQTHDMGETDCKNIDMTVTIEPYESTLAVGDSVELKAYVKGIWNEGELKGKVAFSRVLLRSAIWSSDDPLIADFPNPMKGTVVAKKSYRDPIDVWAKVSDKIPNVRYDPARIKVTGDYIEIRPSGADLCPGDYIFFEAILKNSADESGGTVDVNWESDKPSIANCDPCSGVYRTKITAGDVGDGGDVATFTATSVNVNDGLKPVKFYVYVSREIPKIEITSYKNGDRAFASGANLVGSIKECGTRLIKTLTVVTGSNINSVDVGFDGRFEIGVPLEWGINHLAFSTYDQYDNRVPNNMDGVDFTLRRVPHCLKSESTLQLPTNLYGTPVTYTSLKPLIASVDPVTGVVTGHANGWAPIRTEFRGNTIYRWVGVSTATNYVATHPDDPFYEPEHVPPVPLNSPFGPGYLLATDLNNKYLVGAYGEGPLHDMFVGDCFRYPYYCMYEGSGSCFTPTSIGFLYDGPSFQNIVLPYPDLCRTSFFPSAVNEKGQVVGSIMFLENGAFRFVGFLYDHGVVFFIDHPLGFTTRLTDINNLGKAVGWVDYGTGWGRSFIYDIVYRTFTDIGVVQFGYREVRINDSGQVLVFEHPGDSGLFWIYRDGLYETVAGPSPLLSDTGPGPGGYWYVSFSLHESGKVFVIYDNNPLLLTRCAP